MLSRRRSAVVLAVLALALSCAGREEATDERTRDVGRAVCAPSGVIVFHEQLDAVLVALADHDRVVALDSATLDVVAERSVPGRPHQLHVLGDGEVAVSLAASGEVAILRADLSEERARVAVGGEPGGLASLDGVLVVPTARPEPAVVWVSTRPVLAVLERTALADPRPTRVAWRSPFHLVVTHEDGIMSVLNRSPRELRFRTPLVQFGPSTVRRLSGLVPRPGGSMIVTYSLVNTNPLGLAGVDEQVPPVPYYAGAAGTGRAWFGSVGVVNALPPYGDPSTIGPLAGWTDVSGTGAGVAAACTVSDGSASVIAVRGTGEVRAFMAQLDDAMRSRPNPPLQVGVGVEGLTLSPFARRVYAYNPFTETVTSAALRHGSTDWHDWVELDLEAIRTRQLAAPVLEGAAARGRELFHSVDENLAFQGAISCSSCHPDGGTDGLTWQFPEGPRQTQPLWGGVRETAPFHWDNLVEDLHQLNEVTVQSRMGGTGLLDDDLEDLGAYLDTLRPPPPPHVDGSAAARGQALFDSEELGCRECHTGPHFTDGLSWSVGTSATEIRRESLEVVATPALHGLAATAPYLHDGSAPTLRDLVDRLVVTDRMGRGSRLTEQEIDDLVTYLLTL